LTPGDLIVQTIHPHPDNFSRQAVGTSAAYQLRLQSLQLQIQHAQRRQRTLLFPLAILILGAVIALCQPWHLAAAIPVTVATFLLRRLFALRKDLVTHSRVSGWYERGVARIQETWHGKGSGGEEFARPEHPYASDLNIVGESSLVELLATTRSAAGAERLAAFLLDPADIPTVRQRQDAVRELQPATELRESVALVGPYAFQECHPHLLRQWIEAPALPVARILPLFLALSSGSSFAIAILILIRVLPWLPSLSVPARAMDGPGHRRPRARAPCPPGARRCLPAHKRNRCSQRRFGRRRAPNIQIREAVQDH
jgi:hypothetical protein